MSLANKSLTELRGIAQLLGIPDVFQRDKANLVQAIELKHGTAVDKPQEIPKPEYDARLMTLPPAKKGDAQMVEELLTHHVARGLKLRFDAERWYMSFDKRNDEGTLRMPPRIIIKCADKVLLG